jgi:sulfur-carrier protein
MKTITIRYFAMFRDNAGVAEETRDRHGSSEPSGHCKVAINDEMADWDAAVSDGDTVLLFPPVAGG